ncbi:hypothetical protein DS909_19210 [Phaeobacter gallaeciensis]|uniref:Uncharacterized protein n=1 Tax=Phaeobacter gallaeciensis TaxID=60890 RepID=A0A366WPT8_9RHOB|nr:hypothetical protein DS909_19210 [Phaeobacter gallaeciensis]
MHASFFIDQMRVSELRDMMAEASGAMVGLALPAFIKLPDMPEYADMSDVKLQEHLENSQGMRCIG